MNTRLKRSIIAGIASMGIAVGATACMGSGGNSGKAKEERQQKASTNALLRDQPLPYFAYSQLRQNLKEIETAQAKGVQTTSFFFNQGVADPIMSCASIGAPIPTTASLSNPDQVEHHGDTGGGNAVIGQMEPTGVYPGDSSGTYVICLDSNGKPYAQYWEGFVNTVFAPATWDETKHKVRLLGDPSYHFTKSQ